MTNQKNNKEELIKDLQNQINDLKLLATNLTEAATISRDKELSWVYAMEGNRDGVWDWNAITNEVFFSARWKEMLGFDEDEITNELSEWDKRIHPDDKDAVYADLNAHLNGNTSYYENEHRVQCKDGSYKWILDRGKVLSWTEDDKPLRVVGTHTDITYRKEAEIENQRLLKELKIRQRQLDRDLVAAAGIQQSLLPQVAPVLHNLQVVWKFAPSESVGGDIFNLFRLDEHRVGIYMLDVSGHGVPAALLTVSVHQALQPMGSEFTKRPIAQPPYYEVMSPGDVCRALDLEYPFERFEKYFSIFYTVIDTRTGQLSYSSAGHPPAVLQRSDGRIEILESGGGIIGLNTPEPFETGTALMTSGDRLIIYTDGITEHYNHQDEPFGMERLCEILKRYADRGLNESLAAIFDAVSNFEPGFLPQDDISLLALKFNP